MNPADKSKIKSNLVKITENLTLDEIFIAHMEEAKILTPIMVGEIKVCTDFFI